MHYTDHKVKNKVLKSEKKWECEAYMSKKLLEGLKVIDVSTVIAAPFAAGLLADFGADVIKVEMPEGGDPFRSLGPYKGQQGLRWPCMGATNAA